MLCHRHGLWCGLDTPDGERVYGYHIPSGSSDSDPIHSAVLHHLGDREEIGARVRDFFEAVAERPMAWYTPVEPPDATAKTGKPLC